MTCRLHRNGVDSTYTKLILVAPGHQNENRVICQKSARRTRDTPNLKDQPSIPPFASFAKPYPAKSGTDAESTLHLNSTIQSLCLNILQRCEAFADLVVGYHRAKSTRKEIFKGWIQQGLSVTWVDIFINAT